MRLNQSCLKPSASHFVPCCSIWSHLEQQVQSLLNGTTSLPGIQRPQIPEILLESRLLLSLSVVMGTTSE